VSKTLVRRPQKAKPYSIKKYKEDSTISSKPKGKRKDLDKIRGLKFNKVWIDEYEYIR